MQDNEGFREQYAFHSEAERAIENLDAQIGVAESNGLGREHLLVPLGLLAVARAVVAASMRIGYELRSR